VLLLMLMGVLELMLVLALRLRGLALLRFLLGAEIVAAVGARGHRIPGGGGTQAAIANIVESRGIGVGAGFARAGNIEIVLDRHSL
jgi:hypothetical protein